MKTPEAPKPRDPGQKVRKGDRKWLLRTFVGRDAQGTRHYRSETFLGSSKDADKRLRTRWRWRRTKCGRLRTTARETCGWGRWEEG